MAFAKPQARQKQKFVKLVQFVGEKSLVLLGGFPFSIAKALATISACKAPANCFRAKHG